MDLEQQQNGFQIDSTTLEEFKVLLERSLHFQVNHTFSSSEKKLHDIQLEYDTHIDALSRNLLHSSWEDRYEWLTYRRQLANKKTEINNYFEALREYHGALTQINLQRDEEQAQSYHINLQTIIQDHGIQLINNLGQMAMLLKAQELAILAFQLVTRLDQRNLKAQYRLAKAYLESQDFENAQRQCEKAEVLSRQQQDDEAFKEIQTLKKSIMSKKSFFRQSN